MTDSTSKTETANGTIHTVLAVILTIIVSVGLLFGVIDTLTKAAALFS